MGVAVPWVVVNADEGVADICGKEKPFNVDGPAYE